MSELLAAIGVEAGADVTVAVNGELAARDTPLREGAEVMVLSPMEGGAAGAATTSCPHRDLQIKKAFQDVVAPETHELRGEIRRLDRPA